MRKLRAEARGAVKCCQCVVIKGVRSIFAEAATGFKRLLVTICGHVTLIGHFLLCSSQGFPLGDDSDLRTAGLIYPVFGVLLSPMIASALRLSRSAL